MPITRQTGPTRRHALLTAALGAAALRAGPASARAADVQQPGDKLHGLKLGAASYSFRALPLEATIKAIRRIALRYVSIKEAHLPLKSTTEERQAVAAKFRAAGIEPLSCGVVHLPDDEAKWRNAFEYARDIAVPTIVIMPEPASLPMIEKLVKEFDIKVAIHNHGPEDTRFPSPYDALKAIEGLDPRVGLCIDVGHSARAKADPAKAIRDCRERLYDVHMKDVADLNGKGANVEVEVGRGVLDTGGMLAALIDIKFAGHVGFEHEKDAADPLPGFAESVGFTRGVLTRLPA